jgi:hypothetical protein
LLREGWETVSHLCNTDEESKVHTVASRWLNICRIGFKIFEKKLTLNDVMAEDGATQTLWFYKYFSGLKHENNPKSYSSQNGLIILDTIQLFYQISNCFSKQSPHCSKRRHFINVVVINRDISCCSYETRHVSNVVFMNCDIIEISRF